MRQRLTEANGYLFLPAVRHAHFVHAPVTTTLHLDLEDSAPRWNHFTAHHPGTTGNLLFATMRLISVGPPPVPHLLAVPRDATGDWAPLKLQWTLNADCSTVVFPVSSICRCRVTCITEELETITILEIHRGGAGLPIRLSNREDAAARSSTLVAILDVNLARWRFHRFSTPWAFQPAFTGITDGAGRCVQIGTVRCPEGTCHQDFIPPHKALFFTLKADAHFAD